MFVRVWNSYTGIERRNIAIYILGIMFYKLGLEFFNGSITTMATDRFKAANTFTKLGAASGINQAAQCVGAILIAPLVQRFPTRTVLGSAVLFFGLMTTILLIVDAGTGGHLRKSPSAKVQYGDWDPNAIFAIWTFSGIAYGMVELIRRVIPCDIVGGHVGKLRRMDATVHVCYEIAGTAGAFSSSSAISRFGNNYSFFLTPVFFTFAGASWFFISTLNHTPSTQAAEDAEVPLGRVDRKNRNYFVEVWQGTVSFVQSVWVGAMLIFGHRKFVWLFPGYALALYLHRFLENTLAPAYAKNTLGISAWSQIIVGGSNFGELLGALSVFLLSDHVATPIPWIRLDALLLNIVWVLPHFSTIAKKDVTWAWRVAGCFIPISYGWAAGDVSLAAYIQSALSARDYGAQYPGVSALGAVMAFLYSSYIVMNAILSTVLGKVIDRDFTATKTIHHALTRVGGIQFSVCCGVIMLATLIPKGAFSLNPKTIEGVSSNGYADGEESSEIDTDSDLHKEKEKNSTSAAV